MKAIKKYFCILLVFLCTLSAVACGSVAPENTEIISAKLKKDGMTVVLQATLTDDYLAEHKGERIYLLATDSSHTERLSSYTVLEDSKLKNKLTFKFNLKTDAGDSLLSSAFVLARLSSGEGSTAQYVAVTNAVYIGNPEIRSTNAKKPADSASIKALTSTDVYNAELLGADRILFEADINKLMLSEYREGAINHVFDNLSYYFDPDEVAKLDKLIGEACTLDIRVYLRTTLKYPEKNEYGEYLKAPITSLYCPGAEYGQLGYLPNMENSSGAGYVKAFYDFLAKRYSGEKGLVLDYIIGEQVNSFATNCNAGNYDSDRFRENYLSWVRTAHNILSAKSKNAQVYISTDNILQTEHADRAIGLKAFLTSFAADAKASGDFSWAVALSLGSGEDLSAVLAGDGKDYSRLGVNNLSDLFELLNQEAMLFNTCTRKAIVDNLSLSNSIRETNRAAYYTYTYYKVADAGFDAFFFDSEKDNSTIQNSEGNRTEFYYAILMSGSNTAGQLKSFTDKIPTSQSIDLKAHNNRHLTYEQEVKTEVSQAIIKNRKELPFTLESLKAAAGAVNANLGRDSLTGKQNLTAKGSIASSPMVLSCFDIEAAQLIESGYIGITMSTVGEKNVMLIISDKDLKDGKSAVYVGETKVTSTPTTYYFNITDFTGSIQASDSLQLSLCVLKEEANKAEVSLTVSDMALFGSSGNGSSTVISVIIVAVSTLAICGLLFLLTQRRKKHTRTFED